MKKNLYLYICIGILVIFTVGYFVTVNNLSYAFADNEEAYLYDRKINEVKVASLKYAQSHQGLFKDNETIYVTVDDLVDENLLEADNDGKVKDPSNPIKNLNSVKIRITKKDNSFEVKVLI